MYTGKAGNADGKVQVINLLAVWLTQALDFQLSKSPQTTSAAETRLASQVNKS